MGNETVLHSFCSQPSCADGQAPDAGVIRDPAGNLYGTTGGGGASGQGVVFKVDAAGHETVLHAFTGGYGGGNPDAGVIRDPAGDLYGTTTEGGAGGLGLVYKLDAAGGESVLYAFRGGADGYTPLVLA